MFMLHPQFSKLGMIANVQPKIQIVDTHGLPGNLINIDVAVGVSQFNRTLVRFINVNINHLGWILIGWKQTIYYPAFGFSVYRPYGLFTLGLG
jgi:hypothetical protein